MPQSEKRRRLISFGSPALSYGVMACIYISYILFRCGTGQRHESLICQNENGESASRRLSVCEQY